MKKYVIILAIAAAFSTASATATVHHHQPAKLEAESIDRAAYIECYIGKYTAVVWEKRDASQAEQEANGKCWHLFPKSLASEEIEGFEDAVASTVDAIKANLLGDPE